MTEGNPGFRDGAVNIIFNASFEDITGLCKGKKPVILTDKNIFAFYEKTLAGFQTIVIEAGENIKIQSTVDDVIQKMLDLDIDKACILVGVGGGVVTDIAGYVASIYKRGIRL